MQIKYKEANIYFTSRGSGKPLVLLHGFLESSEIWGKLVAELAKERQVICIDLPGHGNSGCFGEIHEMSEMARAVRAVLDKLEIEKVSFAGHSMGGYVSLEFYNIFPTMVTALVLVNSTPEADSDERKRNRDRATRLVKENKQAFVSMAISNLLTRENNKKFRKELEVLKNSAMNIPTQGITAALQGMKLRKDHTKLFAEYDGNKHIIAGEQDPVMDFERIKKIAATCKSRFKGFPDGHLAYMENSEALLNYLHFIE